MKRDVYLLNGISILYISVNTILFVYDDQTILNTGKSSLVEGYVEEVGELSSLQVELDYSNGVLADAISAVVISREVTDLLESF